jgi:CSLREA domain-containing protein
LLTLGLLAGSPARALSRFTLNTSSGASARLAQKTPAHFRRPFQFKPQATEVRHAFQPSSLQELMSASRWASLKLGSLFATITVNTTADTVADDSTCSLREAILAANDNLPSGETIGECAGGAPGQDMIVFALGAGTPTITLSLVPLPAITEAVTIQGNTGLSTRVRINGFFLDMLAVPGLQINAGGTNINSLVISNFTGSGIKIKVGGDEALSNKVQNCYIGTDEAGTMAQGNGNGIDVGGSYTLIGGNASQRNVISGNSGPGIISTANVVTIEGNYIGTNAGGIAALANGTGITINGGNNNSIVGNVISGNSGDGVEITGGSNNIGLVSNLIGRNFSDTANIPNGGNGVMINGASENVIGLEGSPNTITANGLNGVLIADGQGIRMSNNSIFGNTGLGIDLGADIDLVGDGVTANDAGDFDPGPNGRQNFPVISSVTGAGTGSATLSSASNSDYHIEFFANTTCDPSGNGEGEVFVGFQDVTTNGEGDISFDFNFTPVPGKPFITATATDVNGNTSEFSACQAIVMACSYSISPTVASFPPLGGGGMVSVTAGEGCAWTAVSNVSWIMILSGTPGSGNGMVSYQVLASESSSPRSGTMTIAGQTFTVTQIVDGAIIVGDFSSGIPPAWEVVDGGDPVVYDNTGTPLTWTTMNPCNQIIPAPFVPPFAIVDAGCTVPGAALDEELRLPPFDATGLGSVFVEFYSQFEWDAVAPNNKGDVDVSTDGGMTWTNVLRLENADDGVPIPVLKSLNIAPYITANPANVLVRLHYYGMSPPASLRAAALEKVSWAVDFGVYSYTLTSANQSFPKDGGTGEITVAASEAIPSPQGEWTAVSNDDWIVITGGSGPTRGPGTVSFTVAPNSGPSRNGSLTVSGRIFNVTQAGCSTITLSLLPNGTAGTAYNQTITASPSGSYTFGVTAGSLPPGLSLAPSGALTGTPTTSGTYNFTVTATGAGSCTGNRAYTLTIGCPTIVLAPTTLPNAQVNTSYSQTITATPASGSYIFGLTNGTLPTGLTLSAAGLLAGTPTQNGTFNFRITATGFGTCSGFRDYQIVVSGCATITVIPPSLSDGVVGKSYSQNVNASPTNNYTFMAVAGNLPNGLSLDSTTGKLTGKPKKAGTYTFTVIATAGACTGSRAYTIRITGPTSKAVGDYDGDEKADFTVWRGMTSEWLIVKSGDGQVRTELWGAAYDPYRDVIAPGDYDGDSQSDLAVFRRSNGYWFIKSSSDGTVKNKHWGLGTDVPVPGDYDGDGQTDIAVWRGAEGNWYIVRSSDGAVETVWWGAGNAPYFDVPVPADYDGDGLVDVAVFRQATGYWYIKQSSDGLIVAKRWGLGTDLPVPSDYDGDGKADIAVWRGADTNWYVVRSSDGAIESVSWGTSDLGDVPVPSDYDGDGKTDFAVWRPRDGRWYVKSSLDNSVLTRVNGRSGDTPVMGRR